MSSYVHGYSEKESCRLADQAGTLTELLHGDTAYPAGSRVLEAGCGVGAQTLTLSRSSPEASFECMDISAESLIAARRMAASRRLTNVAFRQGDIYRLPYRDGSFEHVFICFVLEHLSDPPRALAELRRVLKPGGTLTAIEGDHGSWYCHPHSRAADLAVRCLVKIQAGAGGDALIGRRLYPPDRRGRFCRCCGQPADGICGCIPAGPGGRLYPQDLHRHGGGGQGPGAGHGPDRCACVGSGDRGSLPDHRSRRDLLLHIFQGDGQTAMKRIQLKLSMTDETCSVCRLSADEGIPHWVPAAGFVSITRTADELSVVCASGSVPPSVRAEHGFRILKIDGPLDFSLTGILSAVAGPLAEAGISIFAVSTYDTDYVLLKAKALNQAVAVLQAAGHFVQ